MLLKMKAAARWLRRALPCVPRRRWQRPGVEEVEEDTVGGAAEVSSLTLVFLPAVETDRLAVSILLKQES